MTYRVGTRIKFRLYTGRDFEGIVRSIIKTAAGTKLRMEYGIGPFVAINPEQIIDAEKPAPPDDVEL